MMKLVIETNKRPYVVTFLDRTDSFSLYFEWYDATNQLVDTQRYSYDKNYADAEKDMAYIMRRCIQYLDSHT